MMGSVLRSNHSSGAPDNKGATKVRHFTDVKKTKKKLEPSEEKWLFV